MCGARGAGGWRWWGRGVVGGGFLLASGFFPCGWVGGSAWMGFCFFASGLEFCWFFFPPFLSGIVKENGAA